MLCFRKFLVAKKLIKMWEGGVSNVSVEKFLSQSAEKFRRGIFCLSVISGIERIYASKGYVTIFRPSFFVSQYRNIL